MLCIVAMIIAGILGIFSASYRQIAKDAFNCVFKNLTLRACDSGADQRLKTAITAKLMNFSPKAAGFTFKYFNIISWIFVIMMFLSVGYSAYSFYNFIEYGNCNGPDSSAFCIFDPFKNNKPANEYSCSTGAEPTNTIKLIKVNPSDPYLGSNNPKVTVIFAGCFKCKYTKAEYPVIEDIIDDFGDQVKVIYKDFPISSLYPDAQLVSESAMCANKQNKFWDYAEIIFKNQDKTSRADLISYAKKLNLNINDFTACLDTFEFKSDIETNVKEATEAGIYGTPTIFVNNQVFVGPKPYSQLKKAIKAELALVQK